VVAEKRGNNISNPAKRVLAEPNFAGVDEGVKNMVDLDILGLDASVGSVREEWKYGDETHHSIEFIIHFKTSCRVASSMYHR
jgi:hypothetical protein